ncbi:hypothetical protein E1176_03015 [Fulvivirga sp. RKSG066]|uniref:hypothetical protein n=1 Tax=Fulvivirga aurantia TaxID=2529383 RepID=UPI0012BC8D46|nr:hypothetical protein [Fulvivirga aurantia]MTI19983.1 hypothetical protein [Fulvivirga aurantia]
MSQLATQLDELDLECEKEEAIIEGFMERYDVSKEEAEEIFEETKKWLWLAAQSDEESSVFIDKPLLIIDEMWHTFILHTKQYYNFCLRNFKKLVHHLPTPPSEKRKYQEEIEANPAQMLLKHEEKLKSQYSLIYDKLGPETLLKWYDTIAQKYTPEYINSIKKV